jgi:hypothetical protein
MSNGIERRLFFRKPQLTQNSVFFRLGSVAGPVIQATGRSEFEDGLGSDDLCAVHLPRKTARLQPVFVPYCIISKQNLLRL